MLKLHECAEAKLEEDMYKTVQTVGLLFYPLSTT